METNFDDKQIESLRKRAEAKAKDEAKKLAEDKLFEKLLAEERVKLATDPNEEQVTFTLDMAENQNHWIVLDGKYYMKGQEITCSRGVFDTIRDIVARGWEHQAEIEGKKKHHYSYNGLKATSNNNVTHRINTSDSLRG